LFGYSQPDGDGLLSPGFRLRDAERTVIVNEKASEK